jgi:hypothetical protein
MKCLDDIRDLVLSRWPAQPLSRPHDHDDTAALTMITDDYPTENARNRPRS